MTIEGDQGMTVDVNEIQHNPVRDSQTRYIFYLHVYWNPKQIFSNMKAKRRINQYKI